MRLLSVSFKYLKINLMNYPILTRFNSDSAQPKFKKESESLIEIAPSWPENVESELRSSVLRHMQVIPNFITENEENQLMKELEPYLKKMRYEFDHWDNAIHGFRETERSKWTAENVVVIDRLKAAALVAAGPGASLLPHVHVLDLAATGHIKPHIDAVRFCGDVIAGVCLLSAALMRLRHEEQTELMLDILLPRRCLYLMSGVARYSFTHEVLEGDEGKVVVPMFRGHVIRKTRRVSLICRSEPRPESPVNPEP